MHRNTVSTAGEIFFVHMATIVLGLLIAIALEQSVEALHHRHELREMHAGLKGDAERNLHATEAIHDSLEAESDWVKRRIAQVRSSFANHSPLGAPPERARTANWDASIDPTWSAAKSSGFLALVPADEVKAYTEIANMVSSFPESTNNFADVVQRRISFEAAICLKDCLEGAAFKHLTLQDAR